MESIIENWKAQVKRGYLQLCILLLIQQKQRLYGFELLENLEEAGLPVKEGTLYPLLNRMAVDKTLRSVWETENISGHPRKFYSLTKEGTELLVEMQLEFERMVQIYGSVKK